ncbi:phage portal protein [Sphingomonas sp. WKB10]|nr:phage portal protein [Sphingomonas sp. WKB10]
MGLLDFFGLQRKSAQPITNTRDLLASFGSVQIGGETVNRETALQVSAVLCCAKVIAEGLAQVPLKVFREDNAGSPVEARDHPLYFYSIAVPTIGRPALNCASRSASTSH